MSTPSTFRSLPTQQIYARSWNGQPSFGLLPTESYSAFNEAIFDPASQTLVVVTKEKKTKLQMVQRLDQNGRVIIKTGKLQEGEEPTQTQRISVEEYYQYYLEGPYDIRAFVELHAINPAHEAYTQYFPTAPVEPTYPASDVAGIEPNYQTEFVPGPTASGHQDTAWIEAPADYNAPVQESTPPTEALTEDDAVAQPTPETELAH